MFKNVYIPLNNYTNINDMFLNIFYLGIKRYAINMLCLLVLHIILISRGAISTFFTIRPLTELLHTKFDSSK